jgi:hypothetical protein
MACSTSKRWYPTQATFVRCRAWHRVTWNEENAEVIAPRSSFEHSRLDSGAAPPSPSRGCCSGSSEESVGTPSIVFCIDATPYPTYSSRESVNSQFTQQFWVQWVMLPVPGEFPRSPASSFCGKKGGFDRLGGAGCTRFRAIWLLH